MLTTELCCSSIRANADPTITLIGFGCFLVFIVVLFRFRKSFGSKPRWSGSTLISKTVLAGTEVTVIDRARLSQGIATHDAAGVALDSSVVAAPDSPYRVIIKIRSAVLARQLDTVRDLLSDQLYQRLSASPATPTLASPQRLYLFTNQPSADDPDRIVVQVPGNVAVPGAAAEEWTMQRVAQGWIVEDISAPQRRAA